MNAQKRVRQMMVAAAMLLAAFGTGRSGTALAETVAVTTDVAANADQTGVHHGLRITMATPAVECSKCHAVKFAQWRYAEGSDFKTVGVGSYHAVSATEPMYTTLLGMFPASMQGDCKGCHESGNALAVQDPINDIPQPRTVNVEEGINCLTCHFDGKKMVASSSMRDPRFCATCHNAKSGLTSFYTEWLNDYHGGKTCNECHMEEGSHLFPGYNSPSFVKKAVTISDPAIIGAPAANTPFGISFTLANNGAGHSVPADLLRKLRARVSVQDLSMQEVYSFEKVYYKRHELLGENSADTDVIKAGETKEITAPGVVIAAPGVYTVKIELLQDSNRVGVMNSTAFMAAVYKTILVQ
jgi:hypothetical protein